MLSFILVVVAARYTPALAQSTVDVNVNQTAATACSTAEAVALSGDLHFTYSFTTDSANINTYRVVIASSLSGVGQATQTDYVGNASYGYEFPTTASPAQITLQLGSRLRSQGSAPNLTLIQTVNITVDTSGNISASVAGSSTQCAN
jgi:hypothetical protein